jgi:hypothetical protein
MKKILFLISIVAALNAGAQVKFKLALLKDAKTYQVSMIPDKTWEAPFNITGTGQVTLVATAGALEIVNFKNVNANAEWHFNSREDRPQENNGFDYHSVGLKSLGTSSITYKAGVEVPLFTFENQLPCSGSIKLLNHTKDAYFKNPKKESNVGNYISVYGAEGDAYRGNSDNEEIQCGQVLGATDLKLSNEFKILPNPFRSDLNIKGAFGKLKSAKVVVTNTLGAIVFENEIDTKVNEKDMDLDFLAKGMYTVSILDNGKYVYSEKVVKID